MTRLKLKCWTPKVKIFLELFYKKLYPLHESWDRGFKPMVTLGFTCIGHNEIEHLKILLPQLMQSVDEVIYIDCDSNDGSYEFAQKVGCRVFKRPNDMNLNVNKSFGIGQAQSDWVFYADPDERFSKALLSEIRNKIEDQNQFSGFKLPRKNYFFGYWLRFGGQYPDTQVRLFRNGKGSFAQLHVHERLEINGKIGLLDHCMDHFPYENFSQLMKKFDFYSSFDADFLLATGEKTSLKNHFRFLVFKPLSRFFRRFFAKQGFRDGMPGFIAALFDALGWMFRYLKLWDKSRSQNLGVKSVH